MNRLFSALVHGSLHNRLFVLVAAFVLVGYGAFELSRMPVDVFPDLKPADRHLDDRGRGHGPGRGRAARHLIRWKPP